MNEKRKVRWATANRVADQLQHHLLPFCDRLEIAGSLRRRRTMVGDVELVAISTWRKNLLGDPVDAMLWEALDQLVQKYDGVAYEKRGERYRRFTWPTAADDLKGETVAVDLFRATPETWPVLFAIRTGPAALARLLVTQQAHGGLLPDRHEVTAGRVWAGRLRDDSGNLVHGGHLVELANEREFFELCSCGWIEPEHRDEWMQKHERRRK